MGSAELAEQEVQLTATSVMEVIELTQNSRGTTYGSISRVLLHERLAALGASGSRRMFGQLSDN